MRLSHRPRGVTMYPPIPDLLEQPPALLHLPQALLGGVLLLAGAGQSLLADDALDRLLPAGRVEFPLEPFGPISRHPPQADHLGLDVGRRLVRTTLRRPAQPLQCGRTPWHIPAQPLAHGVPRTTVLPRRRLDPHAARIRHHPLPQPGPLTLHSIDLVIACAHGAAGYRTPTAIGDRVRESPASRTSSPPSPSPPQGGHDVPALSHGI